MPTKIYTAPPMHPDAQAKFWLESNIKVAKQRYRDDMAQAKMRKHVERLRLQHIY